MRHLIGGGVSDTGLSKVADAAGLLLMVSGLLAFDPRMEKYRGVLAVAAALGVVVLLPQFHRVLRWAFRPFPDHQPSSVLVWGEEEASTLARQFEGSAILTRSGRYELLSKKHSMNDAIEMLAKRPSLVIVNHDFTKENYPSTYELLVEHHLKSPTLVVRYYPFAFEGDRQSDFDELPFHDALGVATYVTRIVHAETSRQLTALYGQRSAVVKQNRVLKVSQTATLLMMLAVTFGKFRSEPIRPLQVDRAIQDLTLDFHNMATSVSGYELEQLGLRTGMRRLRFGIDAISQMSDDPSPKQLLYFEEAKDTSKLQSRITDGTEGYTISKNNSIAGCSMLNNATVHWRGIGEKTSSIEAWDADDNPIGMFNADSGRLELAGNRTCTFHYRGPIDTQKDLLCAVGESKSKPAPGSLCLSVSEQKDFIVTPWLRRFMRKEANAIAMFAPRQTAGLKPKKGSKVTSGATPRSDAQSVSGVLDDPSRASRHDQLR